jgi:hypothetical protein
MVGRYIVCSPVVGITGNYRFGNVTSIARRGDAEGPEARTV